MKAGNRKINGSYDSNSVMAKIQKAVMFNISDIITIFDREGNVKYGFPNINQEKIFGWKPEDLAGTNAFSRVHPDDLERVKSEFQTVLEKDDSTVKTEYRLLCKNGSYKPIEAVVRNRLDDPDIGGILAHCHDISERKAAEAALRESEELLRQVVKNDPYAIAVLDCEMRYIAVSDKWFRDYEVSASDVIGKSHYELFPDIPQRWRDIHRRCLNGAIERDDDDHFIRSDGSITYNRWEMRPWRKPDGSIGGVILYTEVTTERKLSEIAKKSIIERYNLASIAAGFGVWDWDIQKNHLVWDDRMYALYRIENDNFPITYEQWMATVHPDDKDFANDEMQKALHGEKEYNTEFRIVLPDNTLRNIKAYAQTTRDSGGNPTRLTGVNYDITEIKSSETRIKSLLAEREIVLKEVHHRIKNFMNTINSLLILQADTVKDAKAIEALKDAGSRVRTMMIIYGKLYQSADRDISAGIYLRELIDEIIGVFPNSKSVRVENTIDDFMLDMNKLQAVGIIINELLTNIMKYAFTGRDNGLIRITAGRAGSDILISVEDNGNTIPESVDFENSVLPGFGIRLIGMLVKQLDGTIRIERGSGTKTVLKFKK